LIPCIFFKVSISLIFGPHFYYFSLLQVLGLVCSYFSRSLRCKIRSFETFAFLIYAYIAMNFPLCIDLAMSHMLSDRLCFQVS
jgi:hypothetical protein